MIVRKWIQATMIGSAVWFATFLLRWTAKEQAMMWKSMCTKSSSQRNGCVGSVFETETGTVVGGLFTLAVGIAGALGSRWLGSAGAAGWFAEMPSGSLYLEVVAPPPAGFSVRNLFFSATSTKRMAAYAMKVKKIGRQMLSTTEDFHPSTFATCSFFISVEYPAETTGE